MYCLLFFRILIKFNFISVDGNENVPFFLARWKLKVKLIEIDERKDRLRNLTVDSIG